MVEHLCCAAQRKGFDNPINTYHTCNFLPYCRHDEDVRVYVYERQININRNIREVR